MVSIQLEFVMLRLFTTTDTLGISQRLFHILYLYLEPMLCIFCKGLQESTAKYHGIQKWLWSWKRLIKTITLAIEHELYVIFHPNRFVKRHGK